MIRPQIGLALGGGVARGWAHIGVLRTLIEAGFKPDIIAGTSIGAVVGGLYLAGRLDELENFARGLSGRSILSYTDFTLRGSSLISGEKLRKRMHEYIEGVLIENLDRHFIAIATELKTGHEAWLRSGPLTRALRASYALPGVFPPVKIEGRFLIDGALTNPVPTSAVRAMGARLVIGVSLHADGHAGETAGGERLFGGAEEAAYPDADGDGVGDVPVQGAPDKPSLLSRMNPGRWFRKALFKAGPEAPGISTVMVGALNILLDRVTRTRLAGDPADVLISPDLRGIGLLEFDRAAELIDRGRAAAEAALPSINRAMRELSVE
ncbi:MAG TPA: patatin-like phospholipase family protein [Micropepsaceae bacterium]|nr:patatin-like phospholipase family protein [Micropepsaceae bacterium]